MYQKMNIQHWIALVKNEIFKAENILFYLSKFGIPIYNNSHSR